MRRLWIVTFVAASLGCSSGSSDSARPTLTERQQDSILARSSIPGASAVGKAMRVADSTSAGIRRADTASP
ncbi:MAG TPA: hypothetical protein VN848_07900 [Gemmatimonadales bacterium]|nr:hypothetical protein [Gemmatimonadales bacterium]